MKDFTKISFSEGKSPLLGALDLKARINKEFTYDKEAATVDTPVKGVITGGGTDSLSVAVYVAFKESATWVVIFSGLLLMV